MKYINANSATYQEMVEALHLEHIGDHNCQIDWGVITQDKKAYEASAVKVMQTPSYLVDMGFADMIVYAKEHFLTTMKEKYDNGGVRHGHDQTKTDLLDLPAMLWRPIAILTDDDRDEIGAKSDRVTILSYGTSDAGKPIFRKTIMAPSDAYRDLSGVAKAACILTYLNISPNEFRGNLERAMGGHRNVLYFDAKAFAEIAPSLRPSGFDNWQSVSVDHIEKYLSPPSDLRRTQIERDARRVANIAYTELERYAENIAYVQDGKNTMHGPLRDAIKTIESMDSSVEDLLRARCVFLQVCDSVRSSVLINAAIARMEPQFARSYLEAIDGLKPENILPKEVLDWDVRLIQSEQDIDRMWETLDTICKAHTIEFSEKAIASDGFVAEAAEANKELVASLNDFMADRIFEIEERYEEQSQETPTPGGD